VLSKKIGIDLGTSTVLVYVKGEGVVLNEPAVMATDEKGGRVLAIGRAATELVGRRDKARAVRPVKDGGVVDYEVAGTMVQHLIGRIIGRQRLFRPDVMLSVPPLVTGVERRSMLEATMQAGAKTAYLIDKPMAAAIGARISVATTDGIVVANLGAGSTDVAAIAVGEMLAMESIRVGGDLLDRAIESVATQAPGLRLASGEAERLKREIGAATPLAPEAAASATVTDSEGRDQELRVRALDVHRAIQESLQAIADCIQRVVDQVPQERRAPLRRNGIVLTGGAAQLRGLAEFLTARTGLPVRVAPDPQSCVAVGSGMALDNLQVVRRGQHYIT
jgi:rod shape-determining protein MreB and related proteins